MNRFREGQNLRAGDFVSNRTDVVKSACLEDRAYTRSAACKMLQQLFNLSLTHSADPLEVAFTTLFDLTLGKHVDSDTKVSLAHRLVQLVNDPDDDTSTKMKQFWDFAALRSVEPLLKQRGFCKPK